MENSLLDLHIHSNASLDGIHSIETIINRSKKHKVKTIAITDHNTVKGVHEFAKQYGVADTAVKFVYNDVVVIPGVEFTARISDVKNIANRSGKFHILCYGFDRSPNSPIMRLAELKRKNDIENDLSYFVYLAQNYDVEFDLEEIANIALNKRMKDKTFQEFKKEDVIEYLEQKEYSFFKNKRELEVALSKCPKPNRLDIEIEDLVKIVHASGGVCLVAHPVLNLMRIKDFELGIKLLVKSGIDGYEKIENSISKKVNNLFEDEFAKHKKIPLISLGSDFHTKTASSYIGQSHGKNIYSNKYLTFLNKLDSCEKNNKYKQNIETELLIEKYQTISNQINQEFEQYSKDTLTNIFLRQKNKQSKENYKKQKQQNKKDVQQSSEQSLIN